MGWLRRLGIVMMCCASPLCVYAAVDKIVVISTQTFQTITGWEATEQAGALTENSGTAASPTPNYNLNPAFANYKNTLYDLAVNDLGLNRIRLEIYSSAENSVDYFGQYLSGQINFDTWKNTWYTIVNDNNDPNVINPAGFHFSHLDFSIDNYVLPMKQRLEARGETLYINLNYVDFNGSGPASPYTHYNNPNDYAELMLATFQHIQNKYGWVPDAIEVVLEPDTTSGRWTGARMGAAMLATQTKLAANGFNPKFIAPSVTNVFNTMTYYNGIRNTPGIGDAWISQHLAEISYHRYGGADTPTLTTIANTAAARGINTSHLEYISATDNDLRQDLTVAQTSAWQQYALTYPGPWDDGSIYFIVDQTNINNPTVNYATRTKKLRQYFKHVRRGAVRIGATTNNSGVYEPVAFVNTNGSNVVVVKNWNSGAAFDVQGLPAGTYGIFYTTDSQWNVALPDVVLSAGQELPVPGIPGSSVITIYSKSLSGGDTTLPTAPTTLSLGSASTTTLTATWSGATDNVAVTGYRLDVSTSSSFGSFVSGYNNLNVLNVSSRVISGLSAGTTYYARVRAYDAAGNTSTNSSNASGMTLSAPDTTAPVLSAITASGITTSSATISWTTNEASDTQVEYGLTTSYGQSTTLNTSMVTSHSVSLSGLSASTLYHYRVKSRDAAGNLSTSADFTFTTQTTTLSMPDPELPRLSVDTTYPTMTGATITVNAGGNFQQALNNAQPGDTIVLEAGATFTAPDGGFILPAKSNPQNKWILIRSSQLSSLPVSGNRVAKSHAAFMPKIIGGTNSRTLVTAAQANYYRFVGVEFGMVSIGDANAGGPSNSVLIMLGSEYETNAANQAHHIIFDRCYVHGNPGENFKRGFYLNSGATGIIDSYISEFHDNGSDTQAILVINGPGPFKFQNNYLEATGENIMFGGGDVVIPNLIPADAEIRGNYFYKPLSWKENDPSYAGYNWVNKNLLELKFGLRILIEGNVFENNWEDAQDGTAIKIKTANQDGGMTWAQTKDVMFRNNIVRRSARGVTVIAKDPGVSLNTQNVKFFNNLFEDITTGAWGGAAGLGRFLYVSSSMTAVSMEHNTVIQDGDAISVDDLPLNTFRFNNNIVFLNGYGIKGGGQNSGNGTISYYFPVSEFLKNAFIGNGSGYPSNNFYPATVGLVNFVNYNNGSGGDYHLHPSSPYKNAATDGTDIGANIDAITTQTQCAISGICVNSGPDTTAPILSSIVASGITTSSATISWTTNEASDTQVFYGTTTATTQSTTLNSSMVTSHTQALTGLLASTTYYFKVLSRDAAGNLATSVNSSFVTLTPPDTTAPVLSAITASGITTSSATISWTTNEASDTQVFYGTTTATTQSTTLNSSMVTSHTQALTGLLASTTYYFKVLSRDAAGNLATSTNSSFVTLTPPDTTAPILSSIVASGITISSATISWSTNEASDTQVFYGTTTATTQSTTLNSSMVTSHTQALTGLLASTTYYFKVLSRDAAGNLATSTNSSFVTLTPPDTTAPVLSSIAASGITTSSATITWTTNEAADTQVLYGTTTATTQSTTLNASMVTSHTQGLTGLLASTTYYFKVLSRDAAGNLATSTNSSFVTLTPPDTTAPNAPTIINLGSASATMLTATWSGATDNVAVIGYRLDVSTVSNFASFVSGYNNLNVLNVSSRVISGLTANTTYYARIRAYDAAGNTSTNSSNASGMTLPAADTTAPILSSIVASGITTSSATISWTTNEASDTQVEYGLSTSYGQSTTLDPSLNVNHSVTIPGLSASTIYHFRVKSRDAAGNLTISADFTLTTLTSSTPPMVPTLSLPSVLTVMDTIHVDYPGSMTGISFIWTFQRTSASSSGSGAISLTPSAATLAPAIANATSTSNQVNLSSLNLAPGNYTITVQAQNSSGTSASATAFVSLTAANLSQARVFPNPWRSDQHTGQDITFDRLTMDGTVKLFDLSGRFIQTLTAPTGSVTWDRRNDSGETVASGIYFYVIEDTAGNKKRGKLVIIR